VPDELISTHKHVPALKAKPQVSEIEKW